MSGVPFYKKPVQAKSGFDWPPKRTVPSVKVSRQEPTVEAKMKIFIGKTFL